MLLAYRPDGTGGQQDCGSSALKRSLEDSLPAGLCRSGRPSYRHVREYISRPRLPLVKLEVGHARFGCTPRAMPGMEIAPSLPLPLPASHDSRYTAIE